MIQPTDKLISDYISRFNKDERYAVSDKAIIGLIEQFPENNKLEDVLLKTSVINDLYGTNVLGTFRMAKHIFGCNIDKGLQNGNLDVVNRIAGGHGIISSRGNKEMRFYSFATKYCNWHNRNAYPIYDSFVEKILIAYRNQYNFSPFKNADLKDYGLFCEVLAAFKKHYSLSQYNFKEIDKFLWMYGKEVF